MVDDQAKALQFYTSVLGFVPHTDIDMGAFRWLTVSSPEGAEGVELVLEPMGFEPARGFQKALFDAGIHYATDQILDLIDHDIRGIHLYTMNNVETASRISENIQNILAAENKPHQAA